MNVKELISLPAAKLKRIISLKAQIERLESKLASLTNGAPAPFKAAAKIIGKKRTMSAAGRRKIALAQKARWAKVRAAKAKSK